MNKLSRQTDRYSHPSRDAGHPATLYDVVSPNALAVQPEGRFTRSTRFDGPHSTRNWASMELLTLPDHLGSPRFVTSLFSGPYHKSRPAGLPMLGNRRDVGRRVPPSLRSLRVDPTDRNRACQCFPETPGSDDLDCHAIRRSGPRGESLRSLMQLWESSAGAGQVRQVLRGRSVRAVVFPLVTRRDATTLASLIAAYASLVRSD